MKQTQTKSSAFRGQGTSSGFIEIDKSLPSSSTLKEEIYEEWKATSNADMPQIFQAYNKTISKIIELTIHKTQEADKEMLDFKVFQRLDEELTKIQNWIQHKPRKPSNLNWTASPQRNIGYLFESLEKDIKELQSKIKEMEEKLDFQEKMFNAKEQDMLKTFGNITKAQLKRILAKGRK